MIPLLVLIHSLPIKDKENSHAATNHLLTCVARNLLNKALAFITKWLITTLSVMNDLHLKEVTIFKGLLAHEANEVILQFRSSSGVNIVIETT